jgi:hypothetical protein
MRVTCLLASILIVALLLYSPATAEDSPSAMNKNKEEVGTKESEAGKDVVEKGVEKSENDVKESQEGGDPGPKEPEEVAPVAQALRTMREKHQKGPMHRKALRGKSQKTGR